MFVKASREVPEMVRQIIHIDEEKCNGCGLCASACHEGAIEMVNGKAKLVRENFCDGFGDCLPGCPTGAITFETREAPEYDEVAVKASKENQSEGKVMTTEEIIQIEDETKRKAAMMAHLAAGGEHPAGGCPGSQMLQFNHEDNSSSAQTQQGHPTSRLNQWPCQIKLVPTQAPFFQNAKLLIAADCTAYAYANMHEEFMRGKTTIIGCPKLDDVDYSEKLTAIIRDNDIKSVTIVRMEVPCCGGLQRAAETALKNSGKFIPWQVVTISRDGKILD